MSATRKLPAKSKILYGADGIGYGFFQLLCLPIFWFTAEL